MSQYRADIYNNQRLINVRYYGAADAGRAADRALAETRSQGGTHADIYESNGGGGAVHVDTVINSGGGR